MSTTTQAMRDFAADALRALLAAHDAVEADASEANVNTWVNALADYATAVTVLANELRDRAAVERRLGR